MPKWVCRRCERPQIQSLPPQPSYMVSSQQRILPPQPLPGSLPQLLPNCYYVDLAHFGELCQKCIQERRSQYYQDSQDVCRPPLYPLLTNTTGAEKRQFLDQFRVDVKLHFSYMSRFNHLPIERWNNIFLGVLAHYIRAYCQCSPQYQTWLTESINNEAERLNLIKVAREELQELPMPT